jgi:hypothetical protein
LDAIPRARADLLGPIDQECAFAYVEQHPDLALPRMCVIAKDAPITDEAIAQFFHFVDNTFEVVDGPFTVCWDARGNAFPTKAQFSRVCDWIGDDERRDTWDSHVQGNTVILPNPLLRGIANLFARIARPPQPLRVCQDEKSAIRFVRENCQAARTWTR